MSTTLLVLAKAPVPGRVKTRLCPPCTPAEAAAVAEAALTDTLRTVVATPGVTPRLVLDGASGPWLPADVPVQPQSDGDLGDRLAAAFATATGPTVLIGMDTPQLTPTLLRAVVDALDAPATDAVLGRTGDGGWWTLGLREPRPDVFTDVPMSTAATGAHQLARLRALGLRTRLVPTLDDVDTFPVARRIARARPGTRFAATVAAVASRRCPVPS